MVKNPIKHRLPTKYVLADLEIDTGRQSVTRSGTPIALPKLSYNLLLALVHAAPNLVSLDELMSVVWPGVVVSHETVTKRVTLLRDALGEDPRAPRYFAGLRGRGYQIIAEVSEVLDFIDNPSADDGGRLTGEHSTSIGADDLHPVLTGASVAVPGPTKLRDSWIRRAYSIGGLPLMLTMLLASTASALTVVGAWHLWSLSRASAGDVDVLPNMFAGTWFGALETCSPATIYSGPFSVAISNTDSGFLHLIYYGYAPDGVIKLTGMYDLKVAGNTARSVAPAGITYVLKNKQLDVNYVDICQHGTLRRQNQNIGPSPTP